VIGAGFDDGRGHVTAYATYRKQNPVLQRDRDYSFCAAASLTAAQATTLGRELNCGGSATSANGSFFTNVGTFQVGPNRTFIPGTTTFNFAPYNYYQRPDERYTFGLFANYEISGALQPYLEAMFMDDRSDAQIAPSGNFFNTTSINCDNPLLSAQQRAIVCSPANLVGFAADNPATPANEASPPTVFIDQNGNPYFRGILYAARRNVEGGGRDDDLQHTDYRIVAGMRGDLNSVWSYDMSYQYGRVVFAQTYRNDFSIQRIARALDVVDGPNPGVDPVCRSTLNGVDAACVPWDIFALGGVSQASLDYLQTPLFSRGITQETVANFSITGLLGEYGFQSPWAADGIAINAGAEYRKEKLDFFTDSGFTSGDGAGQGGATIGVQGEFDVKELFAEVQIPLISDRPFFEQLEFRAGYRYSKYDVGNNSFSTDTYKFEGEWAPVRDIRFRASYNRAVRAPNVVELFSAQSVGLTGNFDPCSGAVPTATAAQCALTGVTAGQYGSIQPNPAQQYNGLLGGNPNLAPEIADSITLGVVLQPRFLPRFALTVDWFDIQIDDAITFLTPDTTIQQCINTGNPDFCSLIHRSPGNGSLWISPNGYTEATNQNIGGLSTRGVDVNASYVQPIGGLGDLNFSFVGTWVDELITEAFPGEDFDCAGFHGAQCGTPTPEWRHKFRVGYTHPSGVGISAQWRYFSAVDDERLSSDPSLAGTVGPGDDHYGSQSYIDLVLTASIGDHYNFRLGANNILDRIPPISVTNAPFGNGNTYPQVYDALGRYIFAGVTLDF
jgi:outer membrane receptor protein involved in Fe transport